MTIEFFFVKQILFQYVETYIFRTIWYQRLFKRFIESGPDIIETFPTSLYKIIQGNILNFLVLHARLETFVLSLYNTTLYK